MNKVFDIIGIIVIALYIFKYVQIRKVCNKYNKINNYKSLSGCEVAQKLLDINGLDNIYVVQTKNPLYEKYDSNRKVIRLSKKIFDDISVNALIMSSREVGYAINDKKKNIMFKIKELLYMPMNVLTYLSYAAIIISAFMKDFNSLRISLLVLVIISIYNALFYKFEKSNLKIIYDQLIKNDLIEKDDDISKLINELSFSYLVNTIHLINVIFDFLKSKVNE